MIGKIAMGFFYREQNVAGDIRHCIDAPVQNYPFSRGMLVALAYFITEIILHFVDKNKD